MASTRKHDTITNKNAERTNKTEIKTEIELQNKVANEYLKSKGINKPEEELTKEDFSGLFEYARKYNNDVININKDSYDKYGTYYSNAYTKRALKTLSQFLNNMLTPIWIRDCAYNIKGYSEGEFEINTSNNMSLKEL